jgi:prolyl-tRNA synthetase
VLRLFDEITVNIKKRAWDYMTSSLRRAETMDEARRWAEEKRGILEMPWCSREECARRVEEELEVKTLGIVWPLENAEGLRCPVCGGQAVTWARYAKTY